MFVSLHLSPQSRTPDDDLEIIESVVRHATAAEHHGAAAICLTEHHLGGLNSYTDSFMLGALLAGRLTRAHVALTVAQVAQHHPIQIVERANLLDVLTRGKCFVALGQGWASPVELGAFGLEQLDGARVTNERIDLMLRAWDWTQADGSLELTTSVDRATLHGRVSPAPFRGRRPLIGRATTTDSTIVATARLGLPAVLGTWDREAGARQLDLYRGTLLAGDLDDQTIDDCLAWSVYTLPVVLAADQRAAEARLAKYRTLAAHGPALTPDSAATVWRDEWTRREVGKLGIAAAVSPEQLVDLVDEHVAAGARGVRILPIQVAAAPDDHDESLDLLFRDVFPQLPLEPLPEPTRRRVAVPTAR